MGPILPCAAQSANKDIHVYMNQGYEYIYIYVYDTHIWKTKVDSSRSCQFGNFLGMALLATTRASRITEPLGTRRGRAGVGGDQDDNESTAGANGK